MPRKQDSDKDRPKSKSKTPKRKENNAKIKKRRQKNKKEYKKHDESESDPDWLPGDEEDLSTIEIQQLMQKMFPSSAGKERLKKLEKLDKLKTRQAKKMAMNKLKKKTGHSGDDDGDQGGIIPQLILAELKNTYHKESGSEVEDEEEEAEEENSEESDEEYDDINGHLVEEEEAYDEDEVVDMLGQNMQFNIVFTVNDKGELHAPFMIEEEEEEEEEEDEDEEDEEKKSEKSTVLKVDDKVIVKAKDWDEPYMGRIIKIGKRNHYDVLLDDKELEQRKWRHIHKNYITKQTKEILTQQKMMEEMQELLKIRKGKGKDAMLRHFHKLAKADEKERKKEEDIESKKMKDKNVIKLRKLLRARGQTNDFKFFHDMKVQAQKHIIEQLKQVNKFTNVDKPYRIALLESNIPVQFKAAALKKLNILSFMDPSSGEYYKIKQWVDAFMRIPFGTITHLPVKLSDGQEECSAFMEEAKEILDSCVYGLNDAKMQIMQFLGQLIANPNSVGSAIAIQGPPGTGKTTLIKEGISKILKRPFALIALGGATDASFLEGHSYTYEGSSWGKVVDILLNSKTMNPVIYFDELDKISETPKGEEITGILTHLIDTTQSDEFHDKYFSTISFDVSKALYIFSYNDENKINPVLKDRMYRIHTAGYSSKEKITIAKEHLIPKISKNINFEEDSVKIDDKTLSYIIETFTEKEKGVRNLKRCLEILYTKINLFKLMKPDSKLFDGQEVLKITSPFEVTEGIVKKLIKVDDMNSVPFGMYV